MECKRRAGSRGFIFEDLSTGWRGCFVSSCVVSWIFHGVRGEVGIMRVIAKADVGYAGFRTTLEVEECSSESFKIWATLGDISVLVLELATRSFRPTAVMMELQKEHHIVFYTDFQPLNVLLRR